MDTVIHSGTEAEARKTERILQARYDFNLKFMAEQGWGDDPKALSIQQILEIRKQPEWIAAGK